MSLAFVLALAVALSLAGLPVQAQMPELQPRPQIDYTGDGVVETADLLDMDGDGLIDIVFRTDFPLQLHVRRGAGDGSFGPDTVSFAYSEDVFGQAFGDLDGDGDREAVFGNPNSDGLNLAVMRGDGTGGTTFWASLSNGSNSFPQVAIGDVTGDGHADIVSNTFVQWSVIAGDGAGGFAPPFLSGAAGTVGQPLLADLDADGDLDLVQVSNSLNVNNASSTLRVERNDGTGHFAHVQSLGLDVRGDGQLADLDADGAIDLVVFGLDGTHSGEGGLYLLRNVGGTFQLYFHESYAALGGLTQDVAAGEMNGEPGEELLITRRGSQGGAEELRVNDGTGHFPTKLSFTGPVWSSIALVADYAGHALEEPMIVDVPIGPTEIFFPFENVTPFAPWPSLGGALASVGGSPAPQLDGRGVPAAGEAVALELSLAAPAASAILVVGLDVLGAPFKGGLMVPQPTLLLGFVTGPAGALQLAGTWPGGVPAGALIVCQFWCRDASGPLGFTASNAVSALSR